MRKIKLDPNDLRVESFATHGLGGGEHTVKAYQCASYFPCDSAVDPKDTQFDLTCSASCNRTACGWTCPGTCGSPNPCEGPSVNASGCPVQQCAQTGINGHYYNTCYYNDTCNDQCPGGGETGVPCLETEQ